ncbi:MAG: CRISPR system precrRNA processing endoribonuclease RAMP protein Cas6 [Thiotrichales bacterium]
MSFELRFKKLTAPGANSGPALPIARLHCDFTVLDALPLPDYAGSLWRGAFGHQLRRVACVTGQQQCPACPLYHSCAYSYVFETPVPPHAPKMRRYEKAPHPFVLRPGPERNRTAAPGESIALEVMLIGHAQHHIGHILYALEATAAHGLGYSQRRLRLDRVVQIDLTGSDHATIYTAGERYAPRPAQVLTPPPPPRAPICLHLLTPLRLIGDGQLVNPERLQFRHLFGNLLRRISMLTSFHTAAPLDADFRGLTEHARNLPLRQCAVEWRDWTRYSSRQKTKLEMGGLIGTLELDAAGLEPFWPYLWLGQFTHVGKGAVMGLGRYEIETR